jgi:hypothetical protein
MDGECKVRSVAATKSSWERGRLARYQFPKRRIFDNSCGRDARAPRTAGCPLTYELISKGDGRGGRAQENQNDSRPFSFLPVRDSYASQVRAPTLAQE